MSLDVYLTGELITEDCYCPHCDNQHTKQTSTEFFSANITHNLNKMADAAGIYEHIWRPEEVGIAKARDLIEPLRQGIDILKADPEKFKQYNPENGWGSYDIFVSWLQRYLRACIDYPDANINVSR